MGFFLLSFCFQVAESQERGSEKEMITKNKILHSHDKYVNFNILISLI